MTEVLLMAGVAAATFVSTSLDNLFLLMGLIAGSGLRWRSVALGYGGSVAVVLGVGGLGKLAAKGKIPVRGFNVLALALSVRSVRAVDPDVQKYVVGVRKALLAGFDRPRGDNELRSAYVIALGLVGAIPTLDALGACPFNRNLLDLGLRTTGLLHGHGPAVLEIDIGQQITADAQRQLVVDILFVAEVEGTVDILQQCLEQCGSTRFIEVSCHHCRPREADLGDRRRRHTGGKQQYTQHQRQARRLLAACAHGCPNHHHHDTQQ